MRDVEVTNEIADDVGRAINKLKSSHNGDLGIIDVIACGKRAIPALRDLLFERDRAGFFEVRCRAVDVLAAFRERDVLLEFLQAPHEVADPVERLGDDAVINAAARALAKYRDEEVFQLLMALTRRRLLPGVVAALGSFGRCEAIPYLISAIAEDECRPAAELALTRFGQSARSALMRAASSAPPALEGESPSRLRQRQSARRLLAALLESNVRGPKL
jgi:hypothetical protein